VFILNITSTSIPFLDRAIEEGLYDEAVDLNETLTDASLSVTNDSSIFIIPVIIFVAFVNRWFRKYNIND